MSVSQGRLVLAAFACLLIAAAGLRFYDLPEKSLRHDEAVAANNSNGSLAEVIPNTRNRNSSPILYPLALWAVQKVRSTPFSLRVLPATASVLTVAVMLFLLPRLGVSRWAAFLAALLATLSVEGIKHAQDAREYSIDALLAVLMIAGLLWYLRDGRKSLLCVALFLAPLLQYGLVLFGAAVIAAAVVMPPPTLAASGWNLYLRRIPHWLRQRIALLLPAACFLTGCTISYLVTVRYQWREGGWGSARGYYCEDAYGAVGFLGCATSSTWKLLHHQMPQIVAILALGVFALMLLASLKRRRFNAIATLTLIAVGIAILAALLILYPLGGTRQNIYLGPVVLLAAGVSIYWAIDSLSALARRAWVAPALAVAVAGAIALAGVGAIWQENPYARDQNAGDLLAFLKEHAEEGDLVYATSYAVPSMEFYQDEKPRGYYYGRVECWSAFEPCIREMANLVVSHPTAPNRIFLVYRSAPILEELELLEEPVAVERVFAHRELDVALITNAKEFKESLEAALRSNYEALTAGEPIIRADFDIYIDDNTLVYVREPCVRADTEAMFFLHLIPADEADLPEYSKRHGFNNLDFSFSGRGTTFDGKCMVRAILPEYDITRIRTGQYVQTGGGIKNLWEEEIRLER